MWTKEEAERTVIEKFCGPTAELPEDDELILLADQTIEKHWGWVFFYTSKLWHETRDIKYAIAGNCPLLVERDSGDIIQLPTFQSVERSIEQYERGEKLHG